MVEFDSGQKVAVPLEEIEIISAPPSKNKNQNGTSNDNLQDDDEDTEQLP
jgi:hypothetical protein